MADYIEIVFHNISPAVNDLLVAKLNEIGFEGFEEEESCLKAFIPADVFDEIALTEIIHSLNISFSKSLVKETNWNQLWESNFQPITIEDFVGIRADFHKPITDIKHELIITPKMSFGTGHHATTYMMIQQMREIDFKNKKVFDFGTGTGILSILAEKLGAAEIIAIDNDEWSIENAAENLKRNNCLNITLKKADAVFKQKFDIILANINKQVILNSFSSFKEQLNTTGVLLLSGLLKENEKDTLKEANKFSLQTDKISDYNNWICIRFRH